MEDLKSRWAPWIGLIAIVAFVWFVYYLLQHLADDDKQWSRAVYIFGGVEAVAFTAFGYFFGKEVHRERADKAETRAAHATKQAQDATRITSAAETRLLNLNTIIQTKRQQRSAVPLSEVFNAHLAREPEIATRYGEVRDMLSRMGPSPSVSDPDWDELATIAAKFVETSGPAVG